MREKGEGGGGGGTEERGAEYRATAAADDRLLRGDVLLLNSVSGLVSMIWY